MGRTRDFYDQYRFNVEKGPFYEEESALPLGSPSANPVRMIAYFLPQFHRIPENDRWWAPAFTEWTNVTKALPRYLGHQQPRMPADLGFYDLTHAETLRKQAELAQRAGVHGFCIHHYWFNGTRLLDAPLRLLLETPDINLNFCLCWANESWSRRWDGSEHEVLMQQSHSPEDDLEFARSLVPAMRDRRYIRIEGRPLLMVYRPKLLPDARKTVERWREFFIEQGVGDPYIVMPQAFEDNDPRVYGMDAAVGFPPHNGGWVRDDLGSVHLLDPNFKGVVKSYTALRDEMLQNTTGEFRLHPGVCPRWDNEARRPGRGVSFYGSTPAHYGDWLRAACIESMKEDRPDHRLVFINAWNEWAEGAHLEPDRHFGSAYLAETRRALDDLSTPFQARPTPVLHGKVQRFMHPQFSTRRRVVSRLRRLAGSLRKRLGWRTL